jgi:hypothetical protein
VAQLKGIANRQQSSANSQVLQFETVDKIEANVPYIIWVGSLNSNGLIAPRASHQSVYNIGNVMLKAQSSEASSTTAGVTMTGTYADQPLSAGKQNGLFAANIIDPLETATQTGRFRAWFSLPESAVALSVANRPLPLLVTVDGNYLTDLRGDINTDGLVNAEDVAIATKSIPNAQSSTVNAQSSMVNGQSSMFNVQSSMFNVPDMNRDGHIDIADLLAILRIIQ